jgi:hypothetical protein
VAAAIAALQERNAQLSARFQNDFKLIGALAHRSPVKPQLIS